MTFKEFKITPEYQHSYPTVEIFVTNDPKKTPYKRILKKYMDSHLLNNLEVEHYNIHPNYIQISLLCKNIFSYSLLKKFLEL